MKFDTKQNFLLAQPRKFCSSARRISCQLPLDTLSEGSSLCLQCTPNRQPRSRSTPHQTRGKPLSPLTSHLSPLTLTSHLSPLTSHLSPLTPPLSPSHLTRTLYEILVAHQLFQTHRATRVETISADSDLRPEAELATVVEPRRGVPEHRR